MLIEITRGAIEAITPDRHDILTTIKLTMQRGTHVFCMDTLSSITALESKITECGLGDAYKVIPTKLKGNYTENLSLKRNVTTFARLSNGDGAISAADEENKKIIVIPILNSIACELLLNNTHFVPEDSNDVDFYIEITKKIKKTPLLKCCSISGGGGNTRREFGRHSINNFCISIIDSDRKRPNGPFGDTAQKFVDEPIDKKHVAFIILEDFREAENLIPSTIIDNTDQATTNPSFVRLLEALQKEERDFYFGRFIDIKDGILKAEIANREISSKKDIQAYTKDTDPDIIKIMQLISTHSPAYNANKYLGLGGSLLQATHDKIKHMSNHKFIEHTKKLSDKHNETLANITDLVFSYCIASNKDNL